MIELVLEAERALSVGLLDQAERLYRQAADADPRNSIAVVGLARVAVERGEEEEAIRHGERALAIDPENQAARRLVARLREVREYRDARDGAAGTARAQGVEAAVAPGARNEAVTVPPLGAPPRDTAPVETLDADPAAMTTPAPASPRAEPESPAASEPESPAREPVPAQPPGEDRPRPGLLRRLFGRK